MFKIQSLSFDKKKFSMLNTLIICLKQVVTKTVNKAIACVEYHLKY